MLKKIFGKKNEEGEDGVKPVKANLGEENKFYYNKELKSWVVRGEEHLVEQKQNLPPPPPKRPITTDSGTRTESMASFSSGSQISGVRKNLYTSTPGLNIMKNTKEQAGGIIPTAGFAALNTNTTLFGPIGTSLANHVSDNSDHQSRAVEHDRQNIQEQNQIENEFNETSVMSVQGKESDFDHLELSPSSFDGYSGEIPLSGQHLQIDQNVSVPSTVYTNYTNQNSANTIPITNRVLPPIPSLPNAVISNHDLAAGVPQRRSSINDSPLSFITTPNVIQNPNGVMGERMEGISRHQNQYIQQELIENETENSFSPNNMGITVQGLNEIHQEHQIMTNNRSDIEDKMNSTISNSESDQTEILYTQNDMRQRQRIRPLSQRSVVSNNLPGVIDKNEQAKSIDEMMDINCNGFSERELINTKENSLPKIETSILELISFFGFRYDEKSQKLIENFELNNKMNMNGQHYNDQKEVRSSLFQVCMNIKENKLKQMDFLVGKVFKSLQDSSNEYDSLMEMILNIGNITNKTFQEISGTINTVMSNSDEIEKELIKTKGLYLDLVKRYKAIYKQYETDVVTLRSELENEKNMNFTNSKEFEERLKKLQDEFSSSEASNNDLLHQYYSYIQNLQEQFDELQQNLQSRDLKLKISEEEIPRLKSEVEKLRGNLEEKQQELKLSNLKFEQLENDKNEELIKLSKSNEDKFNQEKMILIEEHKQELELMEKFSREQDEQINKLQYCISNLEMEKNEQVIQTEQLRSEMTIIEVQVKNLSEDKLNLEKEISSLNSQNQEKLTRINELENILGIESQKMEAFSKELEELKGLRNHMEQKMEEIENEKTQIESELRLEKRQLTESCEKLTKELEDLTLRNQNLLEDSKEEIESEQRKLREEMESKSEEYNKHVSWLESEISRVDEEWRTRQAHLEANYEQLYSQYMDLSSRESEFGTLKDRINELESEMADRNKYISQLEIKVSESQNDKDRISELEKSLENIENQIQDNSERLKESKEVILRGENSINELEAKLESESNKSKSLCIQIESLQELNGTYLAKIKDLEEKLENSEQCREYMSKLEQRMVELEASFGEKCQECDTLKEQHENLLSQNKELENLSSNESNHQIKLENEKLKETNEAVYIKLEAFSRDIDMLNNQLEWVRRYSPQVYEAMLENTYHYPDPSFNYNNENSNNDHEISDIAL